MRSVVLTALMVLDEASPWATATWNDRFMKKIKKSDLNFMEMVLMICIQEVLFDMFSWFHLFSHIRIPDDLLFPSIFVMFG